jgi:hypothetical protein
MDQCLAARALWGQEYRFSTEWGDNSETCSSNAHCGATFTPSTEERQKPYFPSGYFEVNSLCVASGGGSEGIGISVDNVTILTRNRLYKI